MQISFPIYHSVILWYGPQTDLTYEKENTSMENGQQGVGALVSLTRIQNPWDSFYDFLF